MAWLHEYLTKLPAPKYPFPIDAARAEIGKEVFAKNCATCHASARTGTRIPLAEIGTDRNRLDSWNKNAAMIANKVVTDMGIERKGLVEATLDGYIAAFLDGIWLRAPYLHNGSVPSLRDLLEPAAQTAQGVLSRLRRLRPGQGGFRHRRRRGASASARRLDVTQKANGNQGHEFGTTLSAGEKDALVEYLKTL